MSPRYVWSNLPANEKPLSPAQWELMLICWRLGPATGTAITKELGRQRRLKPYLRQVAVQLGRIAEKGYIKIDRNPADGRSRIYSPTIPGDRAMREEVRNVINDMLGRQPRYVRIFLEELLKSDTPGVAEIYDEVREARAEHIRSRQARSKK